MSNNQFNLSYQAELNEGIRVTTLSTIFCSGDNKAHSFIVKAMRDGKPVSLSGATVRGFFIRPDNVTITLEGSVNADGCAVVTLDSSCYNKQGRFQITVCATIDGVTSTLFCGVGGMLLTVTDGFIDEDGVVPSLNDLLAQIDAMEAATAAALEAADRANEAAENAGSGTAYPVVGTVDSDNNIILTSTLADGTYTLKYENTDGTQTEIGTVEVGSTDDGTDDGTEDSGGDSGDDSGTVTTYTNVLTASVDTDGSAYNGGLGYKEGYRYSASGGGDVTGSGLYVTGYIKCKDTDTLYFLNVGMNKDAGVSNGCNMYTFSALGSTSTDTADASIMTSYQEAQWDADGNIVSVKVNNAPTGADVYVRFNTTYLGADSVITINEPIE